MNPGKKRGGEQQVPGAGSGAGGGGRTSAQLHSSDLLRWLTSCWSFEIGHRRTTGISEPSRRYRAGLPPRLPRRAGCCTLTAQRYPNSSPRDGRGFGGPRSDRTEGVTSTQGASGPKTPWGPDTNC